MFLLDCKCKSQELCFHLSATKNKSYLTADSNWRRVKNTSVKHFISLLLPYNAASRTWHRRGTQSPSCPSRADSALTWARKTEIPLFFHSFSISTMPTFAAPSCCAALPLGPTPQAELLCHQCVLSTCKGCPWFYVFVEETWMFSCAFIQDHVFVGSHPSCCGQMDPCPRGGLLIEIHSTQQAVPSSMTNRTQTVLTNGPRFKCSLACIIHRAKLISPLLSEFTKQMQQRDSVMLMFMTEDLLWGLRSSLLREYFLTGPHSESLRAGGLQDCQKTASTAMGRIRSSFHQNKLRMAGNRHHWYLFNRCFGSCQWFSQPALPNRNEQPAAWLWLTSRNSQTDFTAQHFLLGKRVTFLKVKMDKFLFILPMRTCLCGIWTAGENKYWAYHSSLSCARDEVFLNWMKTF